MQKHDLLIAEVGAWSQPVAKTPPSASCAAKCKGQLRLAEELGARCCVSIARAFAGSRWDGFTANYTPEAFEATVAPSRHLDAVRPTRTAYCMEAMQWMIPDTRSSTST